MGMFFTTSTVKDWYPLLNHELFRNIVMGSIVFLIDQNRIKLHGYVIMPNHLHLIFTVLDPFHLHEIFRDFHKFTSQQILKILRNEGLNQLIRFQSDYADRKYQIWQTTHAPKEIVSFPFYRQKLEYIHWNPCNERWKLCEKPEDYPFSSAADYLSEIKGPIPIEKIDP
jgi:REP element-mobilizing transposase RayT